MQKQDYLEFQYNDCLGSSVYAKAIIQSMAKFQYNDCLGSSKQT